MRRPELFKEHAGAAFLKTALTRTHGSKTAKWGWHDHPISFSL